ncbi:hypothetical protein HNY73_018979 [Argiope bruennichi]|uniref:Uncharacterized protein n=1 Tax=Argiope bruennichi TaxID=94029 RepID=A0A8T0EFE2_ARGBR|nr:hypothetical protein HNY73_018979 [Argiope bruennichi]
MILSTRVNVASMLALLIPMALLPVVSLGEVCTLQELHGCLELLQSVTQSNDLLFVTTRAELLALCSKLKESEKCAPKYRHLIHLSENVEEQRNIDEGLRESCCAFNDFVLCKYVYVRRDCGQDAADFLEQHLDRISSPLIHEHCAHYTYATDSCNPSSSPVLLPDYPFLLYFTVTVTLIQLIKGWKTL